MSAFNEMGVGGLKRSFALVRIFVSSYSQEIKVFLLAMACGFLLLFPRLIMDYKLAPSLFQFLEDRIKKAESSGGLKFQRVQIPMQSLSSRSLESQDSELHVEGLIFDPQGDSSVIIDSQILAVGDQIKNFTVKEIKQNEVILEKDRTNYRLSSDSVLNKLEESNT